MVKVLKRLVRDKARLRKVYLRKQEKVIVCGECPSQACHNKKYKLRNTERKVNVGKEGLQTTCEKKSVINKTIVAQKGPQNEVDSKICFKQDPRVGCDTANEPA